MTRLIHGGAGVLQFDREFEGHGFVSRSLSCATLVKQSQFIYSFNYLFYGGNESVADLTTSNSCFSKATFSPKSVTNASL